MILGNQIKTLTRIYEAAAGAEPDFNMRAANLVEN
jgi:hypothetical protein